MPTMCQKDYSDEDDELLNQAEERVRFQEEHGASRGVLDIFEEYREVIEREEEIESERVTVEMFLEKIQEHNKESLDSLPEDFFQKSGKINLIEFDKRAEPTEQECRDIYRIGREIGMRDYEIVNFPVIMGISDPKTLERIPEMREQIKGEMDRLYRSKLSSKYRDIEVVDRIIIMDKNMRDPSSGRSLGGFVAGGKVLADVKNIGLPRVIHIPCDKNGKIPEGERLHWKVIHEMTHLNLSRGEDFRGIFRDHHKDEWIKACYAQKEDGRVSKYAEEQYLKATSLEEGFLKSDFITEQVAAWDTNIVQVCQEMQAFLNTYLSE